MKVPQGYPPSEVLQASLINQAANLAAIQAEIAVLRRAIVLMAKESGSDSVAKLASGEFFRDETKRALEKILLDLGDKQPRFAQLIYQRLEQMKWNPDDPSSGLGSI